MGTKYSILFPHVGSTDTNCGAKKIARGGRAPFCRRNKSLLIKMLLIAYIENSHLSGVIGLTTTKSSRPM